MKNGLLILGVMMLTLSLNYSAIAEETASENSSESSEEESKFCPICGPAEKMTGEENLSHEFDGEIFYFCSKSCLEKFKEDPEKYIEMMAEDNYSEKEHQDHDNADNHEAHDHSQEDSGHEGHK